PTINGHLLAVTVGLNKKPSSADEAIQTVKGWKSPIAKYKLPTAPVFPIFYHDDERYPQPRLHADSERGMRTAVGRIRTSNVLDLTFVAMAHNTVRGAAGGAILNAELLVAKGFIK
ncbi:MAG: Asd/ArgC dimerization domain-containing protein, partial [Balneolaceae bacterium]